MTAPVFGTKPRQRTIGLVATDPPSGLGATNVWLTPRGLISALEYSAGEVECPECDGAGFEISRGGGACPNCNGRRWVPADRTPFDLDPCAAPPPRPWPTAVQMISPPEDGLGAEWFGEVWLNPPYSRSIHEWTDRMIDHGRGVALVFVRSDTAWWQRLAAASSLLLLVEKRIRFCREDGTDVGKGAAAASCLLAFGDACTARLRAAHARGAVRGILLEHGKKR